MSKCVSYDKKIDKKLKSRVCSICLTEKDIECFGVNNVYKDGISRVCKDCLNSKSKYSEKIIVKCEVCNKSFLRKNKNHKFCSQDCLKVKYKSIGFYKIRFNVLKRDNFTCQYCGRKAPDVILEVDHIKPRNGKSFFKSDYSENNLITACRDCNLGKSNRPI